MQKGVSPVVATVVLIMMATLGAVAVWYWVYPLTGNPATPNTTQKGYIVVNDYLNSSNSGCNALAIKNTGGLSLSNIVFEIRDYATGKLVGINGTDPAPANQTFVNVSFEIPSGQTSTVNISFAGNSSNQVSIALGTYLLRVSPRTPSTTSTTGFNDRLFTCS